MSSEAIDRSVYLVRRYWREVALIAAFSFFLFVLPMFNPHGGWFGISVPSAGIQFKIYL